MAEPGDPTTPPMPAPTPPAPDVDHDDLIGFSSAARLQGRPRAVTPPEPAAGGPARDLFDGVPVTPSPQPEAPRAPVNVPSFQAASAPPAASPRWATETPVRAPAAPAARARAVETPGDVENATGLYAVYALILFAVPTLGVAALVALLAVTGRAGPGHPVAASHFVFQQRTLWIGGVAALLGGILIAVGLGVFVLFIVAVWLILRGTSGILALKAGRPVRDPRGWFMA